MICLLLNKLTGVASRRTISAAVRARIRFFGFFNRILAIGKVTKVFTVAFVRQVAAISFMHFMVAVALGVFVGVIFNVL